MLAWVEAPDTEKSADLINNEYEICEKKLRQELKLTNYSKTLAGGFFDNESGRANIVLDSNTKITQKDIDALGENYEKTKNGFIDFLLLDEDGYPLVILVIIGSATFFITTF